MSSIFSSQPKIITGFSQAADGTMALNGGFANRQQYLLSLGIRPEHVVHAGLTHGTGIRIVTTAEGGQVIDATDGLITAEPNLALAMTAADCLLISTFDPVQKVIGQVHAGRRGLAEGIISNFFSTWLKNFPTLPENVMVQVSPGICAQHYTISPEDAAKFSKWPDALQKVNDQIHLDLRKVAEYQLHSAGVQPKNINISTQCTFENSQLFSYRRDQPPTPELQVGYIMRGV